MSLEVKCPTCQRRVPWAGNPFRPFCSERCKLIDLGAWAEGKYTITGPDLEDESPPSSDDEE